MILTADADRRCVSMEDPPLTLGGYMADFVTCQLGDEAAVLAELEA